MALEHTNLIAGLSIQTCRQGLPLPLKKAKCWLQVLYVLRIDVHFIIILLLIGMFRHISVKVNRSRSTSPGTVGNIKGFC